MKYLLLTTFLFGAVFGTLEDIIQQVIANTDTNNDGLISADEVSAQISSFDADGNGIVSKHEFTEGWIATYGDNHPDTNTFFNNLDANGDHFLTEPDMLLHIAAGNLIVDANGFVTYENYAQFIRKMHPGHGNHTP